MSDTILLPDERILDTGAHKWRLQEPTIREYLKLAKAIRADPPDIPAVVGFAERFLIEGEKDTIQAAEVNEVITAIIDMVHKPVIKTDHWPTKESSESHWSMALYMELCTVGRHFSQLPFALAANVTLRQLHYLYYVAYNDLADEQERRILLAGGKIKTKIKRLQLIDDTAPQSTAGMSPKEKAAYYSRLRRQEGRDPGRLK